MSHQPRVAASNGGRRTRRVLPAAIVTAVITAGVLAAVPAPSSEPSSASARAVTAQASSRGGAGGASWFARHRARPESIVAGDHRVGAATADTEDSAAIALDRPLAEGTTRGLSQAVRASGADAWVRAGITGKGVTVAIVDLGFSSAAEYAREVRAGRLGTRPTVINTDCVDRGRRRTALDGESHGLAVAEVVHQQAPGAQLLLYCVNSPRGVARAVSNMIARKVRIASSSLAWFADARGDGSGPAGSVARSVRTARSAGILWVNSAGNEVPQHWGGTTRDRNHDGVLDLGNHSARRYPFQSNFFLAAGGGRSATNAVSFIYQWDEWPLARHRVQLVAYGIQCHSGFSRTRTLGGCHGSYIGGHKKPVPIVVTSKRHGIPAVGLTTARHPNRSRYDQIWQVSVRFVGKSFRANRRYDLFGEGDFDGGSALSCPRADRAGRCLFAAAAKTGSVVSPANSPYALAVGAVDAGRSYGGDFSVSGSLEGFSSQGPTVDHRVKPDIAGWDGLSSYVGGFATGFYGTSAAAPSVAGAAALVKQAYPALGASGLQQFLERRANHGRPARPPNNQVGYVALTLGTPPAR